MRWQLIFTEWHLITTRMGYDLWTNVYTCSFLTNITTRIREFGELVSARHFLFKSFFFLNSMLKIFYCTCAQKNATLFNVVHKSCLTITRKQENDKNAKETNRNLLNFWRKTSTYYQLINCWFEFKLFWTAIRIFFFCNFHQTS